MKGFLRRAVSKGYGALRGFCNGLRAGLVAGCALLPVLAAPAAAADPVTVVALGDSLTAGYGLAPEDGLVPRLQAWLQAEGADAVVLNAGVSGDTTAGALARLDWALVPEADALMVILGGNDMLRGLPPAEARANLDAILDAADRRALPVLLVGMKAPANYGPEYKAAFDAIYPDLAKAHGALLMADFFEGFARNGAVLADPASYAGWMQEDAIHPNAAGVGLIVAALGPRVLELVELAGRQD